MGEDDVSPQSVLELREEVLQRVESVGRKIETLSIVTMFVATALVLGFIFQIVLPYVGGSTTQTVNLTDPALVALEVILAIMALAWLYVGVSDYRFTTRLSSSIRKARILEREIEKEFAPPETNS